MLCALALLLSAFVWAEDKKGADMAPEKSGIQVDLSTTLLFKDPILPPNITTGLVTLYKVYRGTVSGIEVTAAASPDIFPSRGTDRCTAIINPKQPVPAPLLVVATEHRLQTVLESASARGVEVEVMYMEKNGENVLWRVSILDREQPRTK